MNTMKLLLVLTVASFAVAGCDRDDNAAEKAGRAIDESMDMMEQSATDAGNAIEDTCEDVKEGMGVKDTDC